MTSVAGLHRSLVVRATVSAGAATTLGWFTAVRGYPLTVALAAAVLAVMALSTRALGGTRRVPASDLIEAQRRLHTLSDHNQQLALRAAAAAARAEAAAELVSQVEENVRASIVAELHDTVTQTLVAAAFATGNPDVSRERLGDMMRTAEAELRQVMLNSSPVRGNASLASLVERLVDRFEDRRELTVKLHWDIDPDLVLSKATATVLYRFIGEALRNVARHADVDVAEVTLRSTDTEVTAEVVDTGRGYDPADSRAGRGLDLLRSRCAAVGGIVTVDTAPGHGTTMRLALGR